MKVGNFLLSVLHFVYTQNDTDNFGDEVFINQAGYPTGIRCTFDNGWCPGFFNQRKKDPKKHYAEWTVKRGAADSPMTGPSVDHTLGTEKGGYLHLSAQGVRFQSKGELLSINFMLDYDKYCVGLWYHMMGDFFKPLTVYATIPRSEKIPSQKVLVSSAESRNSKNWLFVQNEIKVPPFAANTFANFSIVGVRGFNYISDIAIDDFSFLPGRCQNVTTTKAPPRTTTPNPTTTKITTTSGDPTANREYKPFIGGEVLKCNVSRIIESYLSSLSVCCGGKILRRSAGSKCCNGEQYFNRKQDCCEDRIINSAEQTCCGGKITEKIDGEICCNGEKRRVEDNLKCCGDTAFFDPIKIGCCAGITFDRSTKYCCGNVVVDLDDENTVCCGKGKKGKIVNILTQSCCNGNIFNTADYGCCVEKFVFYKKEERCNEETGNIYHSKSYKWRSPPKIYFGDKHWKF